MRLGERLSGLIAVDNRVIAVTVRRRHVDMTQATLLPLQAVGPIRLPETDANSGDRDRSI